MFLLTEERFDPLEDSLWLTAIKPGKARDLILAKRSNNWQKLLYRVLEQSSKLDTTNPCDMLYASMHLASDYEEGSIQIDYTKIVLDVLFDAIEYHVRHNSNVEFLDEVHARSDLTRRIPTWFPIAWQDSKDLAHAEPYRPSLKTQWGQRQPDVKLDLGSRRLKVRGLNIDGVHRCLTSDLDANNLTADRFRKFPFGKILLSGVSLPDVIQTLFDMFSGGLLSGVSQASIVEVLMILLVMRLEALNLPIRKDGRFCQIAYEAFRQI